MQAAKFTDDTITVNRHRDLMSALKATAPVAEKMASLTAKSENSGCKVVATIPLTPTWSECEEMQELTATLQDLLQKPVGGSREVVTEAFKELKTFIEEAVKNPPKSDFEQFAEVPWQPLTSRRLGIPGAFFILIAVAEAGKNKDKYRACVLTCSVRLQDLSISATSEEAIRWMQAVAGKNFHPGFGAHAATVAIEYRTPFISSLLGIILLGLARREEWDLEKIELLMLNGLLDYAQALNVSRVLLNETMHVISRRFRAYPNRALPTSAVLLPEKPLPSHAIQLPLVSVEPEVSAETTAFVSRSEHLMKEMCFLSNTSELNFRRHKFNVAKASYLGGFHSIFGESWDTVASDLTAQPYGEKHLEFGKVFVSGPAVDDHEGVSYDMRLDIAFGLSQSDTFRPDRMNTGTLTEKHLFKFNSSHPEETEENVAAVLDLIKLTSRQRYLHTKAKNVARWKNDAERDAWKERISRNLQMVLAPDTASFFGELAVLIYDYFCPDFLRKLFHRLRGLILPFLFWHHEGFEAPLPERESPVPKLSDEEKKRLCSGGECNDRTCECYAARLAAFKALRNSAPATTGVR